MGSLESMIPTTKMNARIILRILPTVSNPFVSRYRNILSLTQYLVVFRCRHCSPQQQTPVGSICCFRTYAFLIDKIDLPYFNVTDIYFRVLCRAN